MAEISRSQTLRHNEPPWANALVIGGFTKTGLEKQLSLVGFLMVAGGCAIMWYVAGGG